MRMQSVTCPICHTTREISIALTQEKRFNPICRTCAGPKPKRITTFTMYGCTLQATTASIRCADHTTCPHYEECLDMAIRKNHWNGWSAHKKAPTA